MSKFYRCRLTPFVALMAAAPLLGAQSAIPATYDSASDAGILRELERASARGIPAEPLLAKVREGRLKRANAVRIRGAVVALAARLDSARAALGPHASVEELTAGADAIAAGASPAALRALRAAAPSRPIGPSLGALAQLVASGVPARRAVDMITELLRRNVAAGQVVAFGNQVEADAADGIPAEESATFRMHTLAESAGANAAEASAPVSTSGLTKPGVMSGANPSTKPRRRP